MSRRIELTVDVFFDDGRSLPGFPMARVLNVDAAHTFDVVRNDEAPNFLSIPSSRVGLCRALVFRTDADVMVKLNGQSDGAIPLKAGGVIVGADLIFDGNAFVHATVQKNDPTNLVGLVAGDRGTEVGYGEGGYGEGGYGGYTVEEPT